MAEEIQSLSRHDLSSIVRVCMIQQRQFPSEGLEYKITLHVIKEEWRLHLISSFAQLDEVEHKAGRAPAGGLEDEMSKWLERLG